MLQSGPAGLTRTEVNCFRGMCMVIVPLDIINFLFKYINFGEKSKMKNIKRIYKDIKNIKLDWGGWGRCKTCPY